MSTSANLFGSQSQPVFDFPQSLTEKYRPQSISEFVGLDKPKKIMRKLAANPFPSAWLFVGPSGTGKTTMGLAFAKEINAELHHIPSQDCNLENIERVRKICQYVPMAGCTMHLILVDEADRMTQAAQISLLSKLDATNFPPNTIFIFTCNETGSLEPRFLSRCHVIEFSSYGMSSELSQLLEKVWTSETDSELRPNFARLVKDSANNAREALMRLETELMSA
ncbi:MAG TPA: AAA family ATPase [Candidatus Angelobacter sp.]|nr:AAA family ATPase [Candidatus Angelobacter sp.]